MAKWVIVNTKKFHKQLEKLNKKDQERILDFLEERVACSQNPKILAQPLVGNLAPFWRFRVGDYRIIVDIIDHTLTIYLIEVAHRKEIYDR